MLCGKTKKMGLWVKFDTSLVHHNGDDEDDYDYDDPPSTLMRALVWRPSGVVSSNSSPSLKQKIMMIIHVVEVWLKRPQKCKKV